MTDSTQGTDTHLAERRLRASEIASARYTEQYRRILEAASQVFVERGFADSSVQDIAEIAGLDRASIYYYARGKQEIFRELLEEALEFVTDSVEHIEHSDAPPSEQIRQLTIGLLESYSRYPILYVYFTQEALVDQPDILTQVRATGSRFENALLHLLDAGRETGEFGLTLPPRLVTFAIMGMLNWTYRWFKPGGAMSARQIGDGMAELILTGIRPCQ